MVFFKKKKTKLFKCKYLHLVLLRFHLVDLDLCWPLEPKGKDTHTTNHPPTHTCAVLLLIGNVESQMTI